MALPTPIQFISIPKTGTPCYVLIYNSSRKELIAQKYGDLNYSTPATNTVIVAATYDELASKAKSAGITGIAAQEDGQP